MENESSSGRSSDFDYEALKSLAESNLRQANRELANFLNTSHATYDMLTLTIDCGKFGCFSY